MKYPSLVEYIAEAEKNGPWKICDKCLKKYAAFMVVKCGDYETCINCAGIGGKLIPRNTSNE